MIIQEGCYLTHNKELVTVVKNQDGVLEKEGAEGWIIYRDAACYFWDAKRERYFMHTDPKQDLAQYIGPKVLH